LSELAEDVLATLAPPTDLGDPISMALGYGHYIQNHRVSDLFIETPIGRTGRLRFSRYYWDAQPTPIAVDFLRDLRMGELEIRTKKRFCTSEGWRYIVVRDKFDGEGAEYAIRSSSSVVAVRTGMPLIGPRSSKL
jgi:hypothetical protein